MGGTGYVHLHFDPRDVKTWIRADGIDPRDLIPISSKPPWDTTQDWEGLIIRERTTVSYVSDLFPDHAFLIQPDTDTDEGMPSGSTRAGKILADINAKAHSPFADILFSDKPKSDIGRQPTVVYFTLYVKDSSINKSSKPVAMGDFIENPTRTNTQVSLSHFTTH